MLTQTNKVSELSRSLYALNKEFEQATRESFDQSIPALTAKMTHIEETSTAVNHLRFSLMFNTLEESTDKEQKDIIKRLNAIASGCAAVLATMAEQISAAVEQSVSRTNKLRALHSELSSCLPTAKLLWSTVDVGNSLAPVIRAAIHDRTDRTGYTHPSHYVWVRAKPKGAEVATSFHPFPPSDNWIECATVNRLADTVKRLSKQDGF